jgi:hypothetical protein
MAVGEAVAFAGGYFKSNIALFCQQYFFISNKAGVGKNVNC